MCSNGPDSISIWFGFLALKPNHFLEIDYHTYYEFMNLCEQIIINLIITYYKFGHHTNHKFDNHTSKGDYIYNNAYKI